MMPAEPTDLPSNGLPTHVEDTLEATGRLKVEHDEQASELQRLINRTTSLAGQPGFLVILTVVVAVWIAGNLAMSWMGRQPWDPPPFNWLSAAASLIALYTTLFILAAQRHDDELATHREQLILNLAVLAEQKTTKVIHLLEELRRDSPHLENRVDHEAQAFSAPADIRSVLGAVKESQRPAAAAASPL